MHSSGGYFLTLGYRLRSIMEAKSSWGFVLLILAIQAVISLSGGHEKLSWIYENLGLSREGILAGKVWQFLTYGMLHGGFTHAIFNSLCILMLGSRVEHVLGKGTVWKTLVAGTLTGGVAHFLVAQSGDEAPILVGASGGCVALLLLMTTLSPESRMWPLPISARNLGVGVMVTELILALLDPALGVPGFSRMGETLTRQGLGSWFTIGHACHFGGGMAGFLIGRWQLRPRITAERLRRDRERREARNFR